MEDLEVVEQPKEDQQPQQDKIEPTTSARDSDYVAEHNNTQISNDRMHTCIDWRPFCIFPPCLVFPYHYEKYW